VTFPEGDGVTTPTHHPRRRLVAGFLAALTAGGGLLAAATPAQSQPASCTGTANVTFGPGTFDDLSSFVVSSPNVTLGWLTSRTYAASIPAGTYQLTARSYDGYVGRTYVEGQTNERWRVEFLGAGGTVLATSASTPDLADGIEEASWSGSIGSVTLAQAATQVRVVHAFQEGDSPNSVSPVCVGLQLVCPAGQSIVGGACVNPTTTTAAPATTAPPTTIGITQVLPSVVTPAPPAAAQTAQPSFTG